MVGDGGDGIVVKGINMYICMKIATHDSATGEKSRGLFSGATKCFAKTQNKTIKEQYEAGARYFDLRVDKDLVLCHGLWRAKKTLEDVVKEMRRYVTDEVYVAVTIERNYSDKVIERLRDDILDTVNLRGGGKVKLVYIARKKPDWEYLKIYRDIKVIPAYISVPTFEQYLNGTIKDWRRYIPIPAYLKTITPEVECRDDAFVMVDFL